MATPLRNIVQSMASQVRFSTMRGSPAVQALVLVIGDEPQMRRLLVSALASFGYRSLHVGTKGGPLTRAVGHEPDLVVVDVSHPDVDGVGLTNRLRDWTAAPILALLGDGREKERAEVLDAGANDYLVKPFATGDLLGRVRVWLRQVGRTHKPHIPPQANAPRLVIDRTKRSLLVDGREVHLDTSGVQAAARSRTQPGTGDDGSSDSRRGVGARRCTSGAVPARSGSPAEAENRGRPRPTEVPPRGAGRGLSPQARLARCTRLRPRARVMSPRLLSRSGIAAGLVVVGVGTAVCALLLRQRLTDVVMVYLLGVVVVAMRFGYAPSLFTAAASVAAFDFFFVAPYYSFAVADKRYVVTFAIMLFVALVISDRTERIRRIAAAAREREVRTARLYAMSRELAVARSSDEVMRVGRRHFDEVFQSDVRLLVSDAGGVIQRTEAAEPEGEVDLMDTFASQIGLAMERARLGEDAQRAQLEVQNERLRNALLSSVSHDLRTPLAVIKGAVTALLDGDPNLTESRRAENLAAISDEASRMNRLVSNLLGMTSLEAGALHVRNKQWQPLEEVIGVALNRLRRAARTTGSSGCRSHLDASLVPFDATLIEQLFINLVENATKYTPPSTAISITARSDGSRSRGRRGGLRPRRPFRRGRVDLREVSIAAVHVDRTGDGHRPDHLSGHRRRPRRHDPVRACRRGREPPFGSSCHSTQPGPRRAFSLPPEMAGGGALMLPRPLFMIDFYTK